MRITDGETMILRLPVVEMIADGTQDALIVLVHTDEGITGIGEVDASPEVIRAAIAAPASHALSSGLRQFDPHLICYIAGADPYAEDQLGGLKLTIDGLKKRDQLVFRVAHARKIPVMVTFAGVYAWHVEDTVAIHCNTVAAAKEEFSVSG